jgi:aspartokinase
MSEGGCVEVSRAEAFATREKERERSALGLRDEREREREALSACATREREKRSRPARREREREALSACATRAREAREVEAEKPGGARRREESGRAEPMEMETSRVDEELTSPGERSRAPSLRSVTQKRHAAAREIDGARLSWRVRRGR